MTVQYELVTDEAFFREAFERHFQLKVWRRVSFALRVFACFMLACVSIAAFTKNDWRIGSACLAFAALTMVSRRFDDWRRIRYVKRSPEFGDRFRIEQSQEGLSAVGDKSDLNSAWAVISEAVEFPDGLLLYQGPGLFRWLPHSSLTAGGSAEAAISLVHDTGVAFRSAEL